MRAIAAHESVTRHLLLVALFLLALVAFCPADARARTLPALDRRVVDEAGALDATSRARIEEKLAGYEQSTGHQLAVLVLASLDGDVLEQLSLRAAEQWRLGDARRDDGLLVVLAMKERVARIEVGYGLEGAVPDAVAARVIRDVMAPRLAAGDVAGGVEAGLDSLMRAASGESIGPATRRPAPGAAQSAPWVQLAPILLFVVFTVLTTIARRRAYRRGGDIGGGLWPALYLLSAIAGGGRRDGHAGGSFGGFSGGGGGFGGGGASGKW